MPRRGPTGPHLGLPLFCWNARVQRYTYQLPKGLSLNSLLAFPTRSPAENLNSAGDARIRLKETVHESPVAYLRFGMVTLVVRSVGGSSRPGADCSRRIWRWTQFRGRHGACAVSGAGRYARFSRQP